MSPASHETLGLLLVRDGVIQREQLYAALRLQRQNQRLLGSCLIALGYLSPPALLQALARQLGIPALPPGSLQQIPAAALERFPPDWAWHLRAVPFSWDGSVLGIALADGRALAQLEALAAAIGAPVHAYVALEDEVENVLQRHFGAAPPLASTPPGAEPALTLRPRPAAAELPTRDFGAVLGLDELREPAEPVLLAKRKGSPATVPVSGAVPAPVSGPPGVSSAVPAAAAPPAASGGAPAVIAAPPPPAARSTPLERLGLYDAVEKLYEACDLVGVGRCVGRALLNYFSRVGVWAVDAAVLRLVAHAGLQPARNVVARAGVPHANAVLVPRSLSYGSTAGADAAAHELAEALGVPVGATALLATASDATGVRLLFFADNGAMDELYDDLHDVEMLLQEAQTALGLLGP